MGEIFSFWILLSRACSSVSVLCFFDGLACPSSCQCLADLDKPVCSVGRCSRMVLARAWKIFIQVSDV